MTRSSGASSLALGAGPSIDANGEEQYHAERDLLVERVDTEQVEAVADERDEQHAEDGSPDRTFAAQARPPRPTTIPASTARPTGLPDDDYALKTRDVSIKPPNAAAAPLAVNAAILIRCDLVIDPFFGTAATAALRALRPHGRLVQLSSPAVPKNG